MATVEIKPLITIRIAARMLAVTRQTVSKLIKERAIIGHEIRPRCVRINRESVEAYLKSCEMGKIQA